MNGRLTSTLLVAVALCACKPAGLAKPPVADDIGDIEAVLAANASDLQQEGIAVEPAVNKPSLGGEAVEQQDDFGGEDEEGEAVVEDADEADELASEPAPADAPKRNAYRERWSDRRDARKSEADRCKRICDLAEATCDLADHICGLASRHPDEPRYEQACDNAEKQCEAAAEACNACAA